MKDTPAGAGPLKGSPSGAGEERLGGRQAPLTPVTRYLNGSRFKLRLPSVARFSGWLEGMRLPRVRDRRAAPALVALALVGSAVVIGAYGVSKRLPAKTSFPREAKEMAAAALDAQLAAVTERLEADPEDLQGLVEAGTLHFLKGSQYYRTSMNELEEARRLGALEPRIFYYLGIMYQEEGMLPFAIGEYRRFIRNVPEDREVRLLLGKLLYQTGRFEDAAVQYQSLKTASGTTDPVIEENLGLSLLALKRYDEAVVSFSHLMGRPAFEPRAQFYLGQLAFDRGQYSEARGHFNHVAAALARPDGLPGTQALSVWAAIAANDEKLQDWAAAKEHWDQVVRLDPKSTTAKSAVARVLVKLKAAQRAETQKAAVAKAAAAKAAAAKAAAAKAAAAKAVATKAAAAKAAAPKPQTTKPGKK